MYKNCLVCLGLSGVLALSVTSGMAQDILGKRIGEVPDTRNAVFALKGATVHVGNGQVLSDATVLIRDGLIAAVGPQATVPEGAWEIDASGLSIYPGLIDALAETALKREQQNRGAGRGGGGGPGGFQPGQPPEPNPEGPGLFAHVSAADTLDPQDNVLDGWRQGGVLAVNVAPAEGIFMGKSAVVSLNDLGPRRMVVASPTAMRMSFNGAGFGSYPGSLMGVIAHIKQTLLDAGRYREVHAMYDRNPAGLPRPETNRALAALAPVLSGDLPVIFPAQREREIRRVIELARDFGLKAVVAGGFEALEVTEELRSRNIPVLISLSFPEEPRDRHPEAEDTLRTLQYRLNAPKAAGELERAEVRFAFYSDEVKNGNDFRMAVRKAVESGLDSEDALRAASLSAAEILGVGRQIGSVETGKIANLIVADGDLFAEETKLRHVFVDGEKYDVPEKPEPRRPGGRGERPSAVPSDLTGNWSAEIVSPDQLIQVELQLTQNNRSLSGLVVSSTIGALSIFDGSVEGNRFSFRINVDLGNGPIDIVFEGTADGDSIRGTASPTAMGVSLPMNAARLPGASEAPTKE